MVTEKHIRILCDLVLTPLAPACGPPTPPTPAGNGIEPSESRQNLAKRFKALSPPMPPAAMNGKTQLPLRVEDADLLQAPPPPPMPPTAMMPPLMPPSPAMNREAPL